MRHVRGKTLSEGRRQRRVRARDERRGRWMPWRRRAIRSLAMATAGLLVGGLLTAVGVATAEPATAALNDPISCGVVYGLDQNGDGAGGHRIWAVDTATGAITVNNNFPYLQSLNGLAVDAEHGVFWAARQLVGQSATDVVRVDAATGAFTTTPATMPGLASSTSGVVMGAYSATANVYYYGAVANSILYIYGFDAVTNTAIPGVIARVSLGSGNNGDFAFDSSGRLYIVSAGLLLSVNETLPTTGDPTGPLLTTTSIATPPGGTLGSVAFGGDGFLYLAGPPPGGGDRVVYRVNPSTGAVVSTTTMTPTANSIADFGSCASPNVITAVKNLPDGRVAPTDQFTLTITGGSITRGNTGTTTGTDPGPQNTAAEMAGPVIGVPGQTYTVSETAAGGTVLSDYTTSWTCTDAVSGTTVGSGTGTKGAFTMPDNGSAGADVRCTVDNAATPPELAVTKTSDATADTRPGDTVTYTVTATNTGTGPYTEANPAVVVDDLTGVLDDATYNDDAAADRDEAPTYASPRLTWSGALPAGESVAMTYSVTLGSAGDGSVRNVAWQPEDPSNPAPPACDPADGDGNDPTTGEACAAVELLLPRLSISKTADRTELPAVGDTVTYTITVRNEGPGAYTASAPATATDDLSNVLDAAAYNDDAVATRGTVDVSGDDLSWSGALAAGAEAAITYSVTYTGKGDRNLRNLACVPTADVVPGGAACDTVQIPGAGLTRWKTVTSSASPVVAGTVLTYTLFFRNDGEAAATVDAVDSLVHVLDDADVTAEPTSADLTAARAGDTIAITGSVAAGATTTVTYQVTVRPDGRRGDSIAANFLTDPGTPPPADPTCAPTDPEHPDCTSTPITGLRYTKTVTASKTPATAGTELAYTVTVENTGGTTATVDRDDVLTDVLDDADLTTPAASDTASVTVSGPTDDVLRLRGTLEPGKTAVVTYTVTVKPLAERGNDRADNVLVPPGTTPPTSCDPATLLCTATPIQGYTVSKVADAATTVPGGVVTYTVSVTNTGQVAYTDAAPASFRDDLSDVLDAAAFNDDAASSSGSGIAYTAPTLSWSGALDVGATVTVTYSVTALPAGEGDAVLGNAVTPTGPGGVCDPDGTCATETPVASYAVAKSVDRDAAALGEVVSYTVTVTNTGQVAYDDAAPASFTDDLSAVLDDATFNGDATAGASVTGSTLSWSGPLAVGASVDVTYSVTVNDPGTGDRSLENTVTPTAPGGGCDDDCATTTPIASYTVGKSSSATTAMPGDTVSYTVTVTNTGGVAYTAADPASFTDDLSDVLDDAAYNRDATNGGSVTGDSLSWSGPLAIGQRIEVSYSVTVDDPITGDFTLVNTVTPTGPGGTCADVCETSTPLGSFRVSKTTEATAALPGDVVTYTIAVTNTGQVAYTDADPASFTDDLSAVLDDGTYGGDATADGGTVTFTDPTLAWSGPLAVGATTTVTYSVTVNDPARGDRQLDNTVLTPPGAGGNCAEGSTDPACTANVPSGSFTVAKTVSATSALPGDTVSYTVTVTNTGNVDYTAATSASFTDDLSRVLDDAVYNDDVSAGGAVADGTLTWSGPLAVGETVEVTYSVTVDDPVAGDFSLRNVVAPSAPGGECVEGGCLTDTPIASYTVSKTADVQEARVGGTVTYTVEVTNIGRVPYSADAPASFSDDLSRLLDDAVYNDDASAGATVAGNELAWSGALDVGETVRVTYSVTLNAPGTGDGLLRNAVAPDGPGGRCLGDGSCVTETPVAAYRVHKSVSAGQAVVGDTVTFTITVTNVGRVAYTDERPATFTDDLSSGLAIAAYNGDATGGATYDRPVLSWAGPLDVGETATITYSMTIRSPGAIHNRVVTPNGPEANCAPPSGDADCSTETVVFPPGLAATGSALWAAGIGTGAGLLTLGLWLARRRRTPRDLLA